jgi:hypothetical protein
MIIIMVLLDKWWLPSTDGFPEAILGLEGKLPEVVDASLPLIQERGEKVLHTVLSIQPTPLDILAYTPGK